MALEEISFYNVNGDEINISNLVSQMIDYYDQKLEVGETKITDFNEGSEIRNILEAFAILAYAIMEEQSASTEIAFISTSYNDWLDRIGELPFIDVERNEGAAATGNVTFTLATALSEDYTIPAETLVSSSETELEYVTLTDGFIPRGETSVTVSAECMIDGVEGNVPAGSIDTIEDDTIDTEVVSVSNEYAFEMGTNYEEDEEYRERILANVQAEGFGTIGYYTNLVSSITGVHDVKFVSDTTHTRKAIVNGYTKPLSDSVLLDVITVLSVLPNLVLGHSFTAGKVETETVDLTINLDVTTEIDEDDLLANLTAFFDGVSFDRITYDGLNIDEALTYDKVVSCFSIFPEIVSVTGVLYDGSPLTTITPSPDKVFKIGEITFNQNEVQ